MKNTQYVLTRANGSPYPHNDEDPSPMILVSRAHSKRVIAWLGLRGVKITPASDEQVAAGYVVRMHQRRAGVIG